MKNKEHCTRVDFYKRIDGLFGKFYYRSKSIQDIYVHNCKHEIAPTLFRGRVYLYIR